MGLDMFLKANRIIWFDEHQPQLPDLIPAGAKITSIACEAIYWRKANAIHKWFVDIVQNGEDECRPHQVSREQLTQLRNVCQGVLDNPETAAETLPTQSGFFFGATEYDEWYLKDLEYTVSEIDRVLELFPVNKWDFEYDSSW